MDRCLLLAGSHGPERIPAHPDPDRTDWYLPLHLRDTREAQARLVGQVAAGADVIVAPTWLTHRRALLPLGETRRAASWTAAAVRVARDSLGQGLEARQQKAADAPPEEHLLLDRPTPLVAACLPSLEDEATVATGRLAPPQAASARDYHDQAGIIADAEPDLILVEAPPEHDDARVAVEAALETDLPVWAALGRTTLASEDVEGWVEWAAGAGIGRLLFPPAGTPGLALSETSLAWGGHGVAPEDVPAWLKAGASAIARLDGSTTTSLERLRAAIDVHERVALELARGLERRWLEHVAGAAAMAPTGTAAWVGPAPAERLPGGFSWLLIDASEARQLPRDHYGLVVSVEPAEPALAQTLQAGGLLAAPLPHPHGLRLLRVDASAVGEPLGISRREDEREAR
jgi:Homocysteine S-methyltransferase